MQIPPNIIQDDTLFRFLRTHGVLVRIATHQHFLSRIDEPIALWHKARRQPDVIRLDGYRQLAIRRVSDNIEIGFVQGRRADMADAVWNAAAARPLLGMEDVEQLRRRILRPDRTARAAS